MKEIKIIHCKKKLYEIYDTCKISVWGFFFSNIIDEMSNLSYVTFKGNSEIWSLNTGLIDMKCTVNKTKKGIWLAQCSWPIGHCYLGCHGHDRMVVGFTTAYAISAYHH